MKFTTRRVGVVGFLRRVGVVGFLLTVWHLS
jgi:hypothetical protein